MTGSMVAAIATKGSAARGVVLADGRRFDAPLVVACAGAIQTPTLLQRSGLTSRPVGQGLKDHPSFGFTLRLRQPTEFTDSPASERGERRVSTVLRWSSGVADNSGSDSTSGSGSNLDLEAIVIDRLDDGGGAMLSMVAVGLMSVNSTGEVQTLGNKTSVVTGALATDEDRRRLRTGVRAVSALLNRPELAELVTESHVGGTTTAADVVAMNDEQLDRLIAANPGPYAHPGCSCPMGDPASANAVVSGRSGELGRLIGYDGIYVADSSVMPDLVSGGLQLPILAISERIVSELAGDRR